MCYKNISIKVENITKSYILYSKPIDRLKQLILPVFFNFFKKKNNNYFNKFYALKDISFNIKKGETVGILGNNGAGKSTLLQIICGIITPNYGKVKTNGLISSLLELGTGFNPEFTGKENIYLNGILLGLKKSEIKKKFKNIVNFAEIGDFINQPVKTYSSGMYLRLAFSIQSFIDPDILIIDEAIAVGDINFQYKCFQRIKELKRNGTTIVIVTHLINSILEYADRCIILNKGKIVVDTTDVFEAILSYKRFSHLYKKNENKTSLKIKNIYKNFNHKNLKLIQNKNINKNVYEKRFGNGKAIIYSFNILNKNKDKIKSNDFVKSNELIYFVFKLVSSKIIKNVVLGISISCSNGKDIWGDNNVNAGCSFNLKLGISILKYKVKLPINTGSYFVHCGLSCYNNNVREELDQRRPIKKIKFLSNRIIGGFVYSPIKVKINSICETKKK